MRFEPASPGFKLLAFYKEDCPTCRFALPYLDRLYRMFREDGVVGFAIAQEDAATAVALAQELDLSLPQLVESRPFAVSKSYGVMSVPTLFVIGADAKVVHIMPAFVRRDLEQITAALAGGVERAAPLFRPGESVPELRAG